jgi:hypothetical protein
MPGKKKFSKPMSLGQFNKTVIFSDTPTRVVYSHVEVGLYLNGRDHLVYGSHKKYKKQYLLPRYNTPLCDWGTEQEIVIAE